MRGRAVWLAALREILRAHEVSNREALSRRVRPEEEYQSRRDRLEGIERDCYLPRSDLGRLARHNRFHAKSGKSIISGSPVRPQLLSRATRNSRWQQGIRTCPPRP